MKKLYNIFIILFLFLFITIIFGTIFDNKALIDSVSIKWNIIGFIVSTIVLFILYHFINNKKIKNHKIWILILFIILLLFQVIFIYYMQASPSWDWKIVLDEAQNIVFKSKELINYSYFENFPNNKWLLLVEVLMYNVANILKIKSLLLPTYILNLIILDITALLTVLTAKKLFGIKNAIFTFFLIILSSSFYYYLPILYTDTLSIPIPIALIYCYISYKESKNKKYIYYIGIISAIGFKFKMTTIITTIAIIIDYFLESKIKDSALIISKIFIIFFCGILMLNSIENNVIFNKLNKDNSIPYTHWIMMGLYEEPSFIEGKNSIGAYSLKAYQFTYSFPSVEEKKHANLKQIKQKLQEYGIINYFKFLYRKMIFVWDDGTFYGANFLTEKPIKSANFIQDLCLTSGKYFYLTYSFSTGILLYYYLLFIVSAIKFIKSKKNEVNVLMLTVLGVIIFFLLWEASSKYIYNYVPIFIILSVYGIISLEKFIRSRYEKYIICCNTMLQRRRMFKRNNKKIKRKIN